jgi:hypothetical protein
MKNIDFFKSFYDRENIRRDTLGNSVNIPIAVLTALIAALFFITNKITIEEINIISWHSIFVGLPLILSFSMILITINYLFKSFNNYSSGFNYMEIAFLTELKEYEDELINYHEGDDENVEKAMNEYLSAEFIKYADYNASINDRRSYALFKAKKYLFYSVLAIGITYSAFAAMMIVNT